MTVQENYNKVYLSIITICDKYGYSLVNLSEYKFQIEGSFFSLYFCIDFCNDNSIVWERLDFDSFLSADSLKEHLDDFRNQIYSFMKEVESKVEVKPF